MRNDHLYVGLFSALLLVSTGGCSSVGLMEVAAREAYQQVIELETEIQSKIETENDYYSGAIYKIRGDFRRVRTVDLTHYVTRSARNFVRS